ncbi:MAG: DUF393 domain-containing protein, partial [Bacteroidetes bacterium]
AALQSPFALKTLTQLNAPNLNLGSIIYVDGANMYRKSSAALKIARQLDGAWPLMYGFMIVPKPIRDWVYDYVAKNRYKWFGKTESCWLPKPELKARFLDLA